MGSVLSIDYGTKRIGLAISDSTRSFAFPHGIIENTKPDLVFSRIAQIIEEKDIDLIIVGMPYDIKPSQKKEKRKSMKETVADFVNELQGRATIPVQIVDERLSSFAAEEKLKESGLSAKKLKKFIDEETARLLLEEFLERNKK